MSEHDEIFNYYKNDDEFINYEKTARALSSFEDEIRNCWNETMFHDHLHEAIDDYLCNCEYLDKKYLDVEWFETSQGNLIDIDTLYSIFKEIVDEYY